MPDLNTTALLQGASGAAAEKLYIEDVFSINDHVGGFGTSIYKANAHNS